MALTQIKNVKKDLENEHGVIYINPIFIGADGWYRDDFTLLDKGKILEHFNLEKLPEDHEKRQNCMVDEKKLYKCNEIAQHMYIMFVTFFASEDRQIYKSLATIAEQFNISRPTAQRAIKQLEEVDLIEKLWTNKKGSVYLIKQ